MCVMCRMWWMFCLIWFAYFSSSAHIFFCVNISIFNLFSIFQTNCVQHKLLKNDCYFENWWPEMKVPPRINMAGWLFLFFFFSPFKCCFVCLMITNRSPILQNNNTKLTNMFFFFSSFFSFWLYNRWTIIQAIMQPLAITPTIITKTTTARAAVAIQKIIMKSRIVAEELKIGLGKWHSIFR